MDEEQVPDMGKPRHQWRRGSHEDFFRQVKIFSFSAYLSSRRTTLTSNMEEGSTLAKFFVFFADIAIGRAWRAIPQAVRPWGAMRDGGA